MNEPRGAQPTGGDAIAIFGVMSRVLGWLDLALGLLLGLGSIGLFVLLLVYLVSAKHPMADFEALAYAFAMVCLFFCVVGAVLGAGVAWLGVGLLRTARDVRSHRPRSRVLTLVMGLLAGFMAVVSCLFAAQLAFGTNGGDPLVSVPLGASLVFAIINATYGAVVFVVLLSPRFAPMFEPVSSSLRGQS
jgi:hypothetical protein